MLQKLWCSQGGPESQSSGTSGTLRSTTCRPKCVRWRNVWGLLDALTKLQSTVQGIGAKVEGHKGETEKLVQDLFHKFGPAEAKPYIANGNQRRFKVHWASVDGTGALPQQWKTRCGVRFGFWNFIRHASADAFPADSRCTQCSGQKGLEPSVASGSGASSSTEGSGAESGSS